MSSSNHPLRYDSYKAERLLSVFLCFDYHNETVSPHVFRKLLTYLSVWSKIW